MVCYNSLSQRTRVGRHRARPRRRRRPPSRCRTAGCPPAPTRIPPPPCQKTRTGQVSHTKLSEFKREGDHTRKCYSCRLLLLILWGEFLETSSDSNGLISFWMPFSLSTNQVYIIISIEFSLIEKQKLVSFYKMTTWILNDKRVLNTILSPKIDCPLEFTGEEDKERESSTESKSSSNASPASTQAALNVIQRRRRPKRRSTGVGHVDMDVRLHTMINILNACIILTSYHIIICM